MKQALCSQYACFPLLNIPLISSSQIENFKNDGFLLVKGGFSTDSIMTLAKWTDEVSVMPEKTGRQWVYHEKSLKEDNKKLISRIEYITPFHNGFGEVTKTLCQPVSQLFGEEFVNNDVLSKEGVYSCSFETGYELTPLGITTMKRGNFTFTRTVKGLLLNGINDIIGYHRLLKALLVQAMLMRDIDRYTQTCPDFASARKYEL